MVEYEARGEILYLEIIVVIILCAVSAHCGFKRCNKLFVISVLTGFIC